MEVFDFDGTAAPTFGLGVTRTTITNTFTDPTDGVSFTISVTGIGNGPFISLRDTTGPGFLIEGDSTSGNSIDTFIVTFALATPTAARSAFDTGSVPFLDFGFPGASGVVAAGGGSVTFTITDPGRNLRVDTLTAGFTCFCAGTRIATPEGWTNVEDLQPGDDVRLADGRVVPVRWLGRQQVDTTRAHPTAANPIRITRGALGHGLPERDLRVSKDHAICIDGVLYNAGTLVNGTTIYQENQTSQDGFTYYHVETDAHELILAEGVPTETFADQATLDAFENAADRVHHKIKEMPLPRISAARMVPTHIRDRLRPLIAAEWTP